MRAFCAACFLCVVLVVAAAVTGCPNEDRPPPAEPCPFGAHGDDCRFVWQDACAAPGCVAGSPVVCGDDGDVPGYDCVACGCAGTDACAAVDAEGVDDFSFCLSADVREAERDGEFVDAGLDDDAYVGLFRAILDDSDAMTRDALVERLRARREADPRRKNVAVGGDFALVGDVFADGSFGAVRAGAGCADVAAGVLAAENDGVVLVADDDEVSEATCSFPGVFARCAPPSLSACAEVKGAAVEAVVVLGKDATDRAQVALLRKAARANREQWLVRFDAQLALWNGVFLRPADPRFFVDDEGTALRFSVDPDDPRVVWGLRAPRVEPTILLTFRLMEQDGVVRAFLLEHDITPSQCAFAADEPDGDDVPRVTVDCQKNGARAAGDVFPTDNDLSQLVLTEP